MNLAPTLRAAENSSLPLDLKFSLEVIKPVLLYIVLFGSALVFVVAALVYIIAHWDEVPPHIWIPLGLALLIILVALSLILTAFNDTRVFAWRVIGVWEHHEQTKDDIAFQHASADTIVNVQGDKNKFSVAPKPQIVLVNKPVPAEFPTKADLAAFVERSIELGVHGTSWRSWRGHQMPSRTVINEQTQWEQLLQPFERAGYLDGRTHGRAAKWVYEDVDRIKRVFQLSAGEGA